MEKYRNLGWIGTGLREDECCGCRATGGLRVGTFFAKSVAQASASYDHLAPGTPGLGAAQGALGNVPAPLQPTRAAASAGSLRAVASPHRIPRSWPSISGPQGEHKGAVRNSFKSRRVLPVPSECSQLASLLSAQRVPAIPIRRRRFPVFDGLSIRLPKRFTAASPSAALGPPVQASSSQDHRPEARQAISRATPKLRTCVAASPSFNSSPSLLLQAQTAQICKSQPPDPQPHPPTSLHSVPSHPFTPALFFAPLFFRRPASPLNTPSSLPHASPSQHRCTSTTPRASC